MRESGAILNENIFNEPDMIYEKFLKDKMNIEKQLKTLTKDKRSKIVEVKD